MGSANNYRYFETRFAVYLCLTIKLFSIFLNNDWKDYAHFDGNISVTSRSNLNRGKQRKTRKEKMERSLPSIFLQFPSIFGHQMEFYHSLPFCPHRIWEGAGVGQEKK